MHYFHLLQKINVKPLTFIFLTGVLLLLVSCSPNIERTEIEQLTDPKSTPQMGALIPDQETPAPVNTPLISPLDTIWEEIPIPPTPVPLATRVAPPADPDVSTRYFPTVMQSPISNAIWQAGLLNGLPTDVDAPYPETEYVSERNFATSAHIHDPNQLPAFLEIGQTLVIHLPPLPPDLYVLFVASTGGSKEEEEDPGFFSHESYRRRFLRLRFNDRIIWQRTVPPFHAITKAVLDPSQFHQEGNTVVLENLGTHPIPLDAVWIAPHRPSDTPMFIALDQGEWMNREDAIWVRTVVVHVEGSLSPANKTAPEIVVHPTSHIPSENMQPVQLVEHLRTAWRRVGIRFRILEELGHPGLYTLRAWGTPVREAVMRGMFPVLQINSSPSPDTLEAAAFVFGEVVQVWILPGDNRFEANSKILREQISTARILSTTQPSPELETRGLEQRQFWQAFVLSILDGRNRMQVFARSNHKPQLPPTRNVTLSAQFSWLEAFKPIWMGSRAGWATNSVAEWIMRRETPVILRGGYPGGPFFPDGSDQASDLWWWMKPLIRFGSPTHHPGVANIVASGPDTNPVFLHWAVADNRNDSVQVLVHTPAAAAFVKGTMELPVPWSGPTRMIHHATTLDWSSQPKKERNTEELVLDTKEITAPGESGIKGWLHHDFEMRGMHLFELYPTERKSLREVHAPEEIGFNHIKETRSLFHPSLEPPPAWWSRKEMGEKFSHLWRATGPVNLQVKVDATRDGAPGWDALTGDHTLIPKNYSGVSPLSDTSTRFQFSESPANEPQAMRMFFKDKIAPKADAVGLWIRAHRSAGFEREVDPFHAKPIARFYLGKLPQRQLIEIEYDRWYFISSPARYWSESSTNFPQALMFWPAEKERFQPILEVNSFAAYRLSLEDGIDTPGKTLGFVREREDGSQALLMIGLPDRPAFWSQRLDNIIDPAMFQHVEDAPRVVSAESPDDPPPEEVRHDLEWIEESRLLEVHIPRMPPPPTHWYKQRILDDFPLIGWMMQNSKLSAVLFNEDREPVRTSP